MSLLTYATRCRTDATTTIHYSRDAKWYVAWNNAIVGCKAYFESFRISDSERLYFKRPYQPFGKVNYQSLGMIFCQSRYIVIREAQVLVKYLHWHVSLHFCRLFCKMIISSTIDIQKTNRFWNIQRILCKSTATAFFVIWYHSTSTIVPFIWSNSHHFSVSKKTRLSNVLIPLGLNSLRRRRLTGIGIPIINLRRSDDRLRFIMGIPILIRRRLLSE